MLRPQHILAFSGYVYARVTHTYMHTCMCVCRCCAHSSTLAFSRHWGQGSVHVRMCTLMYIPFFGYKQWMGKRMRRTGADVLPQFVRKSPRLRCCSCLLCLQITWVQWLSIGLWGRERRREKKLAALCNETTMLTSCYSFDHKDLVVTCPLDFVITCPLDLVITCACRLCTVYRCMCVDYVFDSCMCVFLLVR